MTKLLLPFSDEVRELGDRLVDQYTHHLTEALVSLADDDFDGPEERVGGVAEACILQLVDRKVALGIAADRLFDFCLTRIDVSHIRRRLAKSKYLHPQFCVVHGVGTSHTTSRCAAVRSQDTVAKVAENASIILQASRLDPIRASKLARPAFASSGFSLGDASEESTGAWHDSGPSQSSSVNGSQNMGGTGGFGRRVFFQDQAGASGQPPSFRSGGGTTGTPSGGQVKSSGGKKKWKSKWQGNGK